MDLDPSQIPASVREKAKVTLLHDLGVGLAGYRLVAPAYSLAKDMASSSDGQGARLLIDGSWTTVEMATLATAALIHARTQDDTQLVVATHLGCTTLPALLALGDRYRVGGGEFLVAMVAGYEAASAIAMMYASSSTSRGFRATSIYGSLGAAAACSRLRGLSVPQTVSALGLAAAFGGGTNQTWVAGTQEWQYQVGNASRNGLVATLLAERGVKAAPDSLEGVAGHFMAFAGHVDNFDSVGRSLGRDWQIERVTYKPYPVCAINQVPVTAMVELVRANSLKMGDVDQVTLSLAPQDAAYPGTDYAGPFTDVGGALMSAQYCLAMAIRGGTVEFSDLGDFDDEQLIDLTRRIRVRADESLTRNSCRLSVNTVGGGLIGNDFISTPQTFNWDRHETLTRLRAIAGEMPLAGGYLEDFAEIILDLENRTVPDLISSTIRTGKS